MTRPIHNKLKAKYTIIHFVNNTFWSRLFIGITISLMILAVISLWGGDFLAKIINPIKYSQENELILEIHPESSVARTSSKKDIVINYLKNNPNIDTFKEVSETELKELLQDWTNIFSITKQVPLPIIIHVSLKPKSKYKANDLQLALSQKVNNIYVQTEKNLTKQLTSSIGLSQKLIVFIPILLMVIICIVVMFTTIGLVHTQRQSIEVVSFLGASYGLLAKEFAFWILKYSLIGCSIGIFVAFILVQIVAVFFYSSFFIVPSINALYSILLVFLLIPLASSIVAFICVRKVIPWVF